MNSINMNTVKVNGKERVDLLEALANLGKMDADFCGDNGSGCLWKNIDESKYESNMEYLLSTLEDRKTDKEVIEEFISAWIRQDHYYKDHILDVIYDESGKAEYIALAALS